MQKLVQELITAAMSYRAEDIFFWPQADYTVLLFKKHGDQQEFKQLHSVLAQQMINFLKFRAQMDVGEHRRPQTGALQDEEHQVSLRLATVADVTGRETLVVRLLPWKLAKLEFVNPQRLETLRSRIHHQGLVIVSGPTGSGKTTLLYHLMQSWSNHRTLISIEDPVEQQFDPWLQLQVNEEAQMTYAALLKASLRLRPDGILLGEIRDTLTAQAAIQAALSGHFVIATLHARTTGGVLTRLMDLGVSRQDLENTLTLVTYQELIATTTGLKILIDIGHRQWLQSQLLNPQQTFCEWNQDITQAWHSGLVTREVYDHVKKVESD